MVTVPPLFRRGARYCHDKSAGVNPIDVKTRRGGGSLILRLAEADDPRMDLEAVSKTGEGVEEFRIGDPVFGTVNFGRAAMPPSSLRYWRNTSPSNR